MRELETIQDKRDTVLCSSMLLIYAHKKCKTVGVYSVCCVVHVKIILVGSTGVAKFTFHVLSSDHLILSLDHEKWKKNISLLIV